MRVKMNLNVSTWIGPIILDNREVTAGLKINFIQASDGDQTKNFGSPHLPFWTQVYGFKVVWQFHQKKKLVH